VPKKVELFNDYLFIDTRYELQVYIVDQPLFMDAVFCVNLYVQTNKVSSAYT